MNAQYLNTVFFFVILAIASWGAYLLFAPFVNAIFIAAILAILFYPLYEKCAQKIGGRTKIAAAIMLVVVALTIVLPLVGVSAVVVGEVTDVVQNISLSTKSVSLLEEKITGLVSVVPGFAEYATVSEETLSNVAKNIGTFFVRLAQKTYAGVVGSVLGIFVLFFTLFYFFIDGRRLMQKLMFLSPLSDQHEKLLFESFSAMSRATIKGTLIIGLIQGSLGALAFLVAGVQSVMIWWVVMVFLAIIPLIGVGVLGFPFAIYYIAIGQVQAGLIILGAFVFISLFDNYLRPLIVGHDVQMHTLLVFFATLGGIMTFGLMGFIVGPIIMALFVTLWHIYGLEFEQQLESYNRGEKS